MRLLRDALTVVGILLLAAGYAASQYYMLVGAASEYAAKIDQPPVRLLALVFLLAAVVLAFVPMREKEPQ